MLKLCAGTNFSENKSVPLSSQSREEVRKLDQYNDDLQLLCRYHIDTAEELSAFREKIVQKIQKLVQDNEEMETLMESIQSGPSAIDRAKVVGA